MRPEENFQLIRDDDGTPPSQKVSRRLVLGGLTAAGAVAAAGCQIGADGPDAGSNTSGLEADPNIIDRISDRIATEVRALGDTPSQQQVMQAGARWAIYGAKIRGGNIVTKSGFNWNHLWSEWDWENWIKPQIDRATALGFNTVRMISLPRVIFDSVDSLAHQSRERSTAYTLGRVRANGSRLYRVKSAGTSGIGAGPAGTGSTIVDGTVTWEYVRPADLVPLTQEQYDERWQQLVEYSASQRLMVYACLCTVEDFNAVEAGNFRNAELTASIVTTAQRVAKYSNVIALEVFQEGDGTTGFTWQPNTEYAEGFPVNNAGKAYISVVAGTSALSGGPAGTGSAITDGTVQWSYVGIPLLPDDVYALLDALRKATNIPIGVGTPGYNAGSRLWGGYAGGFKSLWQWILADPRGPDFVDAHLYSADVTADVVSRFAGGFGKPLIIGEFGAFPWVAGDWPGLIASFKSVAGTHNLPGCMGSIVWGLAPQLPDDGYVWDATGFVQVNELGAGSPLSTTSGVVQFAADTLREFAIHQPLGGGAVAVSPQLPSRTVQTVASSTTLGSLGDYVVFIGESGAPQLPDAVGNSGRYSFKNIDMNSRTVSTTAAQNIDDSQTLDLEPGSTVEIVSDGSNWRTL